MPIRLKENKYGYFYQYGTHGKKYYFNANNNKSMKSAYMKALKQTKAIHAKRK
jgi:hypothetical protein